MLMSTKANRFAHLLLKAQARGALLAPLSSTENLSMEDAYDIARSVLTIRIAQGEVPIGRKMTFTDRKMWPLQSVNDPMAELIWAPLFDTTVEFAEDNMASHMLTKAQQPRIEPALIFKLARTPAPDITLEGMADSLEWMAHGFEIVTSPYPDWKFEAADAIAAFGLHRKLIIGEPRLLSAQTRRNLPAVLASAGISLSRSSKHSSVLCAAGFGADEAASPLHALWHLHRQLQSQPAFQPLQAGELIATGSWTDAQPVERGEIWSSAFSQISLQGLNLRLN